MPAFKRLVEYIVRVELHEKSPQEKPDGNQYFNLHLALEQQKFMHVISIEGDVYSLPPAEYYHNTTDNIDAVINTVEAIVNGIWWPATILVTEMNDIRLWSNRIS